MNRGREFKVSDLGLVARADELVARGDTEFVVCYHRGERHVGLALVGLPVTRRRKIDVDSSEFAAVWNAAHDIAEVQRKLEESGSIRANTKPSALRRTATALRKGGLPLKVLRENEELNSLRRLAVRLAKESRLKSDKKAL